MNKFSGRQFEVYDLPIPAGTILLHPERAVLNYHKGHSIDMGALCYLRRDKGQRKRGVARKVDPASLCGGRLDQIRKCIDLVSRRYSSAGQRSTTLYARDGGFVRFIDWCDDRGYENVLESEELARRAFRAYVDDLRHLVMQNALSINTASSYKFLIATLLNDFFATEDIDRGVFHLSRVERLTKPTQLPGVEAQGKVLAICRSMLLGFYDLIVNRRRFPYALAVPAYLNLPGDRLWVFPIPNWCRPPHANDRHRYIAYNYEEGRIRTVEEIAAIRHSPIKIIRKSVSKAEMIIDESNQDYLSWSRVERGILAVKSFLMLFIASTGCNPSQAVSMPWSEEMEASAISPLTERQGFRTVKYRAQNRVVSFEIGVEYLPHLRSYLKLREFLLNGRRFDYLFFGFGPNAIEYANGPISLTADCLAEHFYDVLKRLDPTLVKVVPRQWRAAKQDHVIRHHDPVVAAKVMQHSLGTSLKKYSNGSEGSQLSEVSDYLNNIERVVLNRDDQPASGEIRSFGLCLSPGHPLGVSGAAPVTPDCKRPEGCLFCDKYRIHADESDTRKLVSARYCIRKAAAVSVSSAEQFTRVIGAVLHRVNQLLGQIKQRDGDLVKKIEHQVDVDGELDPIWACKMDMLMELELI